MKIAASAVAVAAGSAWFTPVVVSSAYSRYVRANVATNITGGTVTANVGLSG